MKECFVASISKNANEEFPMNDYQLLYSFVNNVSEYISTESAKKGKVILNGNEMVKMLEEKCKINGSNYYIIRESLESIVPSTNDIINNKYNTPSKEEISYNILGKETIYFLEKFCIIFEYLYKIEYTNCFRLVIDNKYSLVNRKVELCMYILCMDPCVLFNDLSSRCYCIILASGTLAPLSTFKSELNCEFPITLESQHVINPSKQVYIYIYLIIIM